MTKRNFPYFPHDYLTREKIRENTYHFTNEQAGMPVKWGKSARYFGKLGFIYLHRSHLQISTTCTP